jgi:hypothetical protein
MTDENRCEPEPEWRDRFGTHWVVRHEEARGDLTPILCNWEISDGAGGWEWPEIHGELGWRYLAPVTLPQTVLALVEALKHADLQLEYIDQRSPSGTTPAVRAQIGAALALYREAGR